MAAVSPFTYTPITRKNPLTPSFTTPSKSTPSKVKPTHFLPKIKALSDPFVLQIAESLEDSIPTSSNLQKLRDSSSESLLSVSWPSRKDESFRFTDTSFIKQSDIIPVSNLKKLDFYKNLSVSEDTLLLNLTIVDGFIVDSLSQLVGLPEGVFIGSLNSIESSELTKRVLEFLPSHEKGDLFWSLNGVGSPDLVVVYVPEGCKVEGLLHLRYVSSEGSDKGSKKLPVSNPRVLVVVEKGGEIGIVEEYMSGDGDADLSYWSNSVMEIVVAEEAKVSHSYIQTQSLNSAHIKWTSVRQEKSSTYELVEVSTGGKLSRHNVHMQQVGPDTITQLSTFHLSGSDQTQDLHSKIVLDHPRGYSRQLHKCIVAHSLGQAVFDGNVQVNRYAQQTDAGQLTRSLILEPRATVNVKPNLQIIADDVKCSHGAAIYDLEEDQLFYLRARGIDLQTARQSLIISFAAEVIARFPSSDLRKKVESHVKKLLNPPVPVEKSV
ncbi:non-intrinsic ABC protein 6 [Artemisia annua]|uniref:Non-intrinsic ABC protein 6 n=1 Tax=Artemisia annua TaxID=35608 RepID=A0A2U1LIK2_ARTAN|nr:non-intrinsic ABC protein 6 [Artemisia annua]